MTLTELIDTIELTCEKIVHDEALRIAAEIRNTTPPRRVLTRQVVRVRRNGNEAKILLQFPRTFGNTNTPTHKRFATQWARIRPEARRNLITELNAAFQADTK